MTRWYLLFPLLSAVLYAVAAMGFKAARDEGVSSQWLTAIANTVTAMAFLGFVDWSRRPLLPDPLWPTLVLGFLFFLGQLLTVLSLSRGDVSVATPVLGTKVLMVAALLACFGDRNVTLGTWVAGALTVAGIGLLGLREGRVPHRRVVQTIVLSLGAALAFALFDVMNQAWSRRLGFGAWVPFAMCVAAALSFVLPATGGGRRPGWSRRGSVYIAVGVGLMAVQAVSLIRAIGVYGDAANANIVYGTRAVWSVAAVWALGHHFRNVELKSTPRLALARLAGSGLILAGLVLVLRS